MAARMDRREWNQDNQDQDRGYSRSYTRERQGGYDRSGDRGGDRSGDRSGDRGGERRGGYGRRDNRRRDEDRGYNIDERIKQAQEQEEQRNSAIVPDTNTNTNTNTNTEEQKGAVGLVEDPARREEYSAPIEYFDDLSKYIDLKLIRGVMAYGFETPSPIQQKAIKPLLGGYDVIAQAQSGTGKTATFCIGTLGSVDFAKNEIQAIVLAHTLELAQQIQIVFEHIGKYLDVRIGLAVRSVPVRDNIDQLMGRKTEGMLPQVVIGTPGRVLDMINKRAINPATIKLFVLDEADELLSDGFLTQIKDIIGLLSPAVQIGLFSATMEPSFFKITQNFMRNPMNILIKKEDLTLRGIRQYYIDCEKNEYKFETLCDLFGLISVSQTIIYCNYYQNVELLTRKLQEENFKVSFIHGNMTVKEREDAMQKFRSLSTRVLISTDLLGRGIDVQQVSIVINYDTPLKIESYIHRIGRSGRHGRKGTAINFAVGNDMKRLKDIERYYDTKIEPLPRDVEKVLADK